MACCGLNTQEVSYVKGSCSVCIECDQDDSEKNVFWCETCKAYICAKHRYKIGSRAVAATKVAGKKIINLLKK